MKIGSDISNLISAMDEDQRDQFYTLIQNMGKDNLDENLRNFTCQDILEDIESTTQFERIRKSKREAVEKGTTTIPKNKWGVHRTHCCNKHGCKYGDEDCPVATDLLEQDYPCEECNG